MNIKILEYILAIAEEGSVSKAAERFYLSQPALSSHLKRLEQEYGAPFFTRVNGRMELTRAGSLFTNNARIVLHLEKQLGEELDTLAVRQRQNLDIFVDHPFTNFCVLEILKAFREMYPQLHLEVNSSHAQQAVNAVREKRADLALCTLTAEELPGLSSRVLGRTGLMLAFPADYDGPLTAAGALDRGLLPMLHPMERTMRMIEEECLAAEGTVPDLILESSSGRRALEQVQAGRCFAYTSEVVVARQGRQGVQLSPSLCTCYTHLAYQPDALAREPVRELIEMISEKFPRHFH